MHEISQKLDKHVAKWFKGRFRSLTPPQRLALPYIVRGENVLICSPTGSGKCITSDEKVLVKVNDSIDLLSGDELIKIAETRGKIISYLDNGKLYLIPSLKVYSIDNNFKTVEAPAMLYVEDYDGEIIEVEMEGGRKIKVTPDHPLLIENKENWVWIPAKNLKAGDKVAVLRKIDCKPTFKKFDAKNALKILREEFKVFTYEDFEKIKKKLEKNNYKLEKLNLEDLEKVRIFCKLTYSDIAKKAKLDLTTVWKFFKGKSKYGKDLILKILKENLPKDIEANRIFVVDGNNKIISFRYPEKADGELVKWVAFVLSEGHICYKNKVFFLRISQKKNLKMLREFLIITKDLFDLEFKQRNDKGWYLNSKSFVKFILAYLDLSANREKKIPAWILNLDDNLVSIFLRWFFSLEAEIRENKIMLIKASEDVIDKILYLLLRFGIFPCLNEETKYAANDKNKIKRKYFSLSICADNLKRFYAKIEIEGSSQIIKQFRNLSEICDSWCKFKEKWGDIYWVKERVGLVLNDGGNPALSQHLNKISNSSHILFVKIKRIKKVKYKGKIVDFTVPNLANFVGGKGAIVLHNTLAAFLFIISELIKLAKQKKLENKVYCVYVSPLRALSRDIQKNLLEPLNEIYEILKAEDVDFEEVRVFVRTGDTPAHEKQKMLKKTPHILITTPETLAIVLNTPKFSSKLTDVKWVIVDEIHELASSKRGVHLSLTLERLQEKCNREFVRIGLSATIAPLQEVAKFLVGYNESGEARKCKIINTYFERGIDLKVLCPVRDLIHTPAENVTNAMYRILADLIKRHRTTLIFTNTRSGTEKVVFHLKNIFQDKIHEYEGIKERIAAHHGSLSRQVRHEVEDKLKKGELKAVICVDRNSKVLTDEGWERISEVTGMPLCLNNNLNLEKGNFRDVFSKKGIFRGFKIKTRLGNEIKCTSEHRFLVIRNSNLVWCEAKDLKVGDEVAVIRRIPTFNQRIPYYCEFLPRNAYVWLKQEVLKDIKEEVKRKFGSIKNFCKKAKVSYKIRETFRGTYPFRFSDLVKILDKLGEKNLLEKIEYFRSNKTKTLFRNKRLSRDFMRFLGYWLADGSWHNSGISIAGEKSLISFYSNSLQKDFNLEVRWERNPRGIHQIKFCSTVLRDMLRIMVKCSKKKSLSAEFPSFLFRLPNEYKWAFLSGYFDGDGYLEVRNGKIYSAGFTTFNKKFAEGIRTLLLQLGVIASVRSREYRETQELKGRRIKKGGICYTVVIYGGENLRKFISSIDSERRDFAEAKEKVLQGKGYCNRDVIPNIGEILRKVRKEAGLSTYKLQKIGYNPEKVEINERDITRRSLQELIRIYERNGSSSYLSFLKKLAYSDLFWDKIVEKKPITLKEIWSLVDVTNSNYVINGFICKNSSTSLELGIDIGYTDLVAQIGSPKSVARLIQRIGRSGHKLDKKPKGRMICLDRDDLVECAVMVREACKGRIDRISIPRNCLDVLAQHILGMSIERKWSVYEAYKLVKRSYCYKDLPFDIFKAVLQYLSGRYATLEGYKVYGKIWYDEQAEEFGRRGKYARVIYSLNIGTIPDEVAVVVFTTDGKFIGMIEEDFLERLNRGDIFVLSGKTYRFLFAKGLKAYVEPAFDLKPTVPSWFSEMLPLSFDLAIEIGKFRKMMFELIDKNVSKEKVVNMLKREYHADANSANSIYEYFVEQYKFLKLFGLSVEDFPSNDVILIERFVDEYGRLNVIFHTLYGRRVNDALSRAFAYVLGKKVAEEVGIAICDNGFALILPRGVKVDEKEIRELFEEVNSDSIADILRDAIRNTELIKRRFRHCATRALMILRNYKGTKIKVSKQQLNAEILLKVCEEIPDFPVLEETFREILEDGMDIKNAEKVLSWTENKKVRIVILPELDTPSPFSHNIVLLGLSDIILMEDKRAMLEKLHRQVMQKLQKLNFEK